jgi:hypothetical protein
MDAKLIMKEALENASLKAQEQSDKLVSNGPAFNVMDGNRCVGQMLDVCGFAHIALSGRNPLVNQLKKIGKKRDNWSTDYIGEGWFMMKSVYKGYHLCLRHALSMRQEMSVAEAGCDGACEVLRKYGIECQMESRID